MNRSFSILTMGNDAEKLVALEAAKRIIDSYPAATPRQVANQIEAETGVKVVMIREGK